MGMAFIVAYSALKLRVNRYIAAIGFGIAVWACLLATLALAPHGQEQLFRLTLTTLSLSLLGHIIYGFVLGALVSRVSREPVVKAELQKTIPLRLSSVQEEAVDDKIDCPQLTRPL